MNVTISKELTSILSNFDVVAFTCSCEVGSSSDYQVDQLVKNTENEIKEKYQFEDLLKICEIDDARKGYKKLGADPNRVHVAVESLYRRILKGNELYSVNNIVDCGNVLSIKTKRSVAVLDLDKIESDVYIRLGNQNDEYYGIGRGRINVNHLPLYCDSVSGFGCPTSDTTRTMITDGTKNILVMIICFNESPKQELYDLGCNLFCKYGKAENIRTVNVYKE